MVETFALMAIASLGVQSVVASNILFYAITSAIYIGASLGLSYLSSMLFKPSSPKPEDVQSSTKQAISPRYRHYGRVKTSGNWVFAESKNGDFHKVLAIGQGPVDAIEEYWIDDNLVTLDGSGDVTTSEYVVSGTSRVRILSRLGTGSDLYYSQLSSVFPEWTSAHRGRGVVSLYALQRAIGASKFMAVFPNVINTSYRVVMRGVKVENPYTLTTSWDDNAAAIIRDYLYHDEGLRLPKSLLTTTLATAGWQAAFDKCDVAFSLKAGGTEARYRLWGSYSLEERPADVLNRMLICCDGRLMITNDGGLTLDIGDIPASPVVIDDSMITGFSELGRGRDVITTANTIRATFVDPTQDYQNSDADPWVDAADVTLRGEISQTFDFAMSPSHSQTRRLMKLAAYRANPNWVGTFSCNLKALAVFGERYCRITYPAFSIDEIFEIQDIRFDIGEGDILRGITIQVQSMPATAYSWDAAQEEGVAPVSDESDGTSTIPVPTNFNAVIQRKTINDQQYPYALLTFDAPPNDSLVTEARGKKTSETSWQAIAVADGATSAESFLLEDGGEYEFQVRYRSLSEGAWTASIVLTAIADTVAPGIITALVVTPGVGKVDMSWQSPNSSNFAATNIYRNTSNTEGTATLIHTEYGAANSPFNYTDTPLAAGSYWYWLRSRNWSGVESASVASGEQVVT